ncbi:unnamed protein product [Parascedosporium putredinis]|uniref:Glucose-methanol-choline oxidoreductase C-terminal domain-containing protein n=1 Tax=Parascedosporium putredinis TaxID=1442378 RepID=A0A9P1MGQ1_9PEZI|nr:unnamed protein product [Parascedosporium putredinis]CAI8004887.1 unnamed protein product [Parascedosporium putredinis]
MYFASLCTVLTYTSVALARPSQHFARHITPSGLQDSYDYVIVGSGPGGSPGRPPRHGRQVRPAHRRRRRPGRVDPYRVPALSLQSTEYEPMRWDYYVNHFSNLTYQKQDSKMTYRTASGATVPAQERLGRHRLPHRRRVVVRLNMRKYFERLEKCSYLLNGGSGHGFSGWLSTSLTDLTLVVTDLKLLRIVLNTAISMGQGGLLTWLITTVGGLTGVLLQDLNVDSPSRDSVQGVYQIPIATDAGSRSGPRQLIVDVTGAQNSDGSRKFRLDVLLDTLVTKVRFDTTGSKPRAVGLLKLSGVGPQAELAAHGIPLVANLPGVGTNLQDRYETTVIGKTTSDFAVTGACNFYRTPDDPCLQRWEAGGSSPTLKGVYASNGIALGVVRKSTAAAAGDDPDTFILGAPVGFKGYYPGYSADSTVDARHWTWLTLKAHTRNRAGTVRLRSADPRDTPLIDFNNFEDPAAAALDVRAVVEGMKYTRGLINSVGGFTEVWPGPQVASDAQLSDWTRKESWGHHASCTCPIGPDGDAQAVLDSKFRVRGVDGLRVVDASVFPRIPGFFIAVPVYMVSEKAADTILGLG